LIIARTDARAVLGFEEAIRRANASLEVGADIGFVEAPTIGIG
jgi:2-methylisocitrate lyase-like PEP mutase family enzyme